MAQAAKFEKQIAGGDAPQRVIALSLGHLIQPHKKHEPLSLRVERLPQGGRLSKGSRNNNGSWSLTPSDLDELKYMPPAGAPAEHALALRIISLVGGDTLAVVEVPVSADAAEAEAAPATAAAPAAAVDDQQLRTIAGELANVRAVLAASEAASAELRRQVEAATALSKQNAEAAHSAERAAWQADLDKRLADAAAQAAAALAEQRKTWDGEQAAALAAAAEQAKKDLAAARESWQREMQEALAKADAAWVEKSAKQVAEARTANTEQSKGHEVELDRLRTALKAAETRLAEREQAFTDAAKAADEASTRERKAAQEALAKAEQSWKEAEAARFAAAETEWRQKLAKASVPAPVDTTKDDALAALRDEVKALKTTVEERDRALAASEAALRDARDAASKSAAAEPSSQSPANDLRNEIKALKATLEERDRALAAAEAANREARDAAQRELQAELAKANETWAGAEAARFAALEAEWREKLAKASASAPAVETAPPAAPAPTPAPAAAAPDPAHEREVRRLREQVATLQGILEDREEKGSRDDEAARLSAELAKARAKAKDEIAALKATLSTREAELARAKSAAVSTPHSLADFEAVSRASSFRVRELVNRPDEVVAQDKKRLMRDLVIAAAIGGALVFFYPDIEALIFGERPIPVRTIPMPRPKPELPAPPVVVPDRTAVAARNARLRGEPSTSAAVAGSLALGTSVIVVEERDGWFLVRTESDGKGEPVQGWVKGTLLKDVMPAPAAPATTP